MSEKTQNQATTIITVAAISSHDPEEDKTYCDVKTDIIEFNTDGVPITDSVKVVPFVITALLNDQKTFDELATMYLERIIQKKAELEENAEEKAEEIVSGS